MASPVALILAGGENRRFWPLAHKSFLRFDGETLLRRRLRALAAAGFHDQIAIANPMNVERVREESAGLDATVEIVLQEEPLGMGHAVLCAADLLADRFADRPLLVNQVHDLVADGLLDQVARRLQVRQAAGLVVGKRMTTYFPGGYLTLRDGLARGVVEKPAPGTEPSDLVKLVFDGFDRAGALLDALGAVDPNPTDQYERALDRLMAASRIETIEYDGDWVAIKFPWDPLRALPLFFAGLAPEPEIGDARVHPSAVVAGPVRLGSGVRVLAGAAIVGPSIVGAGTIVGNGALVRGSIVGENCIVGYAAEVTRSYVGDGCEFHTNYVGDSVIGDDVSFGSGTVTANLRLDEGNVRVVVGDTRVDSGMAKLGAMVGTRVRVGINASLMPGVRVGSGSAIGPGAIVTRDVAEGRFLTVRQDLDDRPNPFTIDGSGRAGFRTALGGAISSGNDRGARAP